MFPFVHGGADRRAGPPDSRAEEAGPRPVVGVGGETATLIRASHNPLSQSTDLPFLARPLDNETHPG